MQKHHFLIVITVMLFLSSNTASAENIVRITTDVPTEFGTYQLILVDVISSVTPYKN